MIYLSQEQLASEMAHALWMHGLLNNVDLTPLLNVHIYNDGDTRSSDDWETAIDRLFDDDGAARKMFTGMMLEWVSVRELYSTWNHIILRNKVGCHAFQKLQFMIRMSEISVQQHSW